MKSYVPFAVAAALLLSGCGKKDDSLPVTTQPPVVKSGESKPVVPAPPLPAPTVPKGKGAEAPSPQPGQVNDHSSPAFKGGGAPDPNK